MAKKSLTRRQKLLRMLGLWFITVFLTIGLGLSGILTVAARVDAPAARWDSNLAQVSSEEPHQLVQQGREYYRAEQWQEALAVWEQAEAAFADRGDRINQAMVLSNLALTYQQLDQLPEAQAAIATSRSLIESAERSASPERARILAQVLSTEGGLQLSQGQAEQALQTWEQATDLYQQLSEESGAIQSLINQAQALRAMGFYQRAQHTLETVKAQLDSQPDSLIKAKGLYNLGNTLRLIGRLDDAETALKQSLTLAEKLRSPAAVNAALFSLGNTTRTRQTPAGLKAALDYYQQAMNTPSIAPLEWTEAQVNRLSLLVETNQLRSAREHWPQIHTYIQAHSAALSQRRAGLYAQINFAQTLLRLRQLSTREAPDLQTIAQQLASVSQYARDLSDQRAQSYALGYLGQLYEQTQQWSEAKNLTEQALGLAQQVNAPDIAYHWQWQLGRLLKIQGEPQTAIASYTEAVNSLQAIRQDLAVVNLDVQFSFKESVEPVYRELVALLLQTAQTKSSAPQEANLAKARDVIESLQIAELDDFFKQACLEITPVVADQIDPKTGLIYAIDLADQIGVILSLPNQPLRYYSTSVSENELNQTLDQLEKALYEDPIKDRQFDPSDLNEVLLPLSQKLYRWLIDANAEVALANSGIDTLAFILDGSLRNFPVAVLHDGEQYLIKRYSVALSPGLQLLNPQRLQRGQMRSLAAGLSKRVSSEFPALENVEEELNQVQAKAPGSKLLNEEFTKTNVQRAIEQNDFPIVHLATHGQFSSNAEDTLILTWPEGDQDDGRINVNELQALLQSRDLTGQNAIELLVLSACQTAEGDNRTALGLAGIAFRTGARSTVATLWPVSDQATTFFMERFYQELTDQNVTKAEALRQAQLALLEQSEFDHPFFWAPYTLIGNWL